MIYVGAENIVSPLGDFADENFEAILNNKKGIRAIKNLHEKQLYLSLIGEFESFNPIESSVKSIKNSLELIDQDLLKKGKNLLLLSTTKGEIVRLKNHDFENAKLSVYAQKIAQHFPWIEHHKLVSNACISGVLALVLAHDLIQFEKYDTIIVSGADAVSQFTLAGFHSFFAISESPCKPFDKDRTGINLGEGVGTLVISKNPSLFLNQPIQLLHGASANDANHISGPSRTGEGLYRSVSKTLTLNEVSHNEIDFISAHGTGTSYNDEMEAIAFHRCGFQNIPLNSLKGYYGHTFGAAGLIESAICLQAMRKNTIPASAGYETEGTSVPINVVKTHLHKELNTVLKTASGFGGCNASILFKK